MGRSVMLTTIDNPYDPFTEFDKWFAFDESKGYHTCSYLSRIARTSDELSDEDELIAIESAIDEIVAININGLYKKLVREDGEGS